MVKFPFYIEQAEAYVAFLPVPFYVKETRKILLEQTLRIETGILVVQ